VDKAVLVLQRLGKWMNCGCTLPGQEIREALSAWSRR
jgi:hypothetical protein